MLDLDYVRFLLALIREYDVTDFELDRNGIRIVVKRIASETPQPPVGPAAVLEGVGNPIEEEGLERPWQDALELAALHETGRLQLVQSPMVGIFHRSARPSEPPLISLGDRVRKGQVICVIEALRVISEIHSKSEGTVVAVYFDDGRPVQYGDLLFALKLH